MFVAKLKKDEWFTINVDGVEVFIKLHDIHKSNCQILIDKPLGTTVGPTRKKPTLRQMEKDRQRPEDHACINCDVDNACVMTPSTSSMANTTRDIAK